MTINEERDIILNALYRHFDKHRIYLGDLKEYLETHTEIREDRIYTVLDDLKSQKYIGEIMSSSYHDYFILPKGESLMDEGGFSNKKPKEKPTPNIRINTGGGDIIGSQVGNHSRDLLLGTKNINSPAKNIQKQYVASNDKPKTFIGKIVEWINNNKILCTLIAAILFYFIKMELDKHFATPLIPTKLDSISVKKH